MNRKLKFPDEIFMVHSIRIECRQQIYGFPVGMDNNQ